MTDHASEQAMELEALEAILMDDLEEYEGMLPPGWSSHGTTYKVRIRPTDDGTGGGEDGGEEELALELLFAHTPTYPDEPPCLKPRSVRGLSDADIKQVTAALDAAVQENLGMAMIYQVVSAAQEWLAARLQQTAGPDPDADRRRAEAEEEARHAALRAHGTPVTPENFAEWRRRFEAEAAAAAAAAGGGDGKGGGGDGKEARLTGRAWFLKQVAAGEVVSGSEGEDEGEEGDFEPEGDAAAGAGAGAGAGAAGADEDEDDSDYEYSGSGSGDDEEDDDEMLESYLAAKTK